ncbi:MAG: hypothetical protein COB49_12070, partial [Alphaproteobacteria bacterium]
NQGLREWESSLDMPLWMPGQKAASRQKARMYILEAEAYAKEVEDRAIGEADRFNSLYQAYKKAPEVTRKRLYLETMERILGNTDKVILESGSGNVLPYLPLPAIKKQN